MRATVLHKLNAKKLSGLGDGLHGDGGGLFLQVKGANRSWVFRHKRDGKTKTKGLGPAASVSLGAARDKAAVLRADLAAGKDVMSKPAPAAPAPADAGITFAEAARRYILDHGPTWSNPKHRRQWESTIDLYAARLAPLLVDQITTADVADCLRPIWLEKPETARRTRGRIERILSASIALGERPPPNPAALKDNLEHVLPKVKQQVKHHRAVAVDDAPEAFAALYGSVAKGSGYAAMVTLCLTALRSGEVRLLQWSDVLEDRIAIPAERMKARRDHEIPLTPLLRGWLGRQPRWSGGVLVHPSRTNRPLSDMTLSMAMRRAGLGGLTPHGWRSTFRDWSAREGFARELAEHQLHHLVGDATERAYARDTLLERRREMMAAWEAFLLPGGLA